MTLVKICGLRDPENILAVSKLAPDYIGLIFYEGSKRFVGDDFLPAAVANIGPKKIGVFVNSPVNTVLEISEKFSLNAVQLHGNESAEDCREISEHFSGETLKAFSLREQGDLERVSPYAKYCTYFLFDTPSDWYGGTGERFNWNILKNYSGSLPYFLSGGIGISDLNDLEVYLKANPLCVGVDANSRLEVNPGLKDVGKVSDFINGIRYFQQEQINGRDDQ